MVAKIMESRCVTFKLQELVRSYLWFKPDLVKVFRVHEAVRGGRTRQNLLQELYRFGFDKQLTIY